MKTLLYFVLALIGFVGFQTAAQGESLRLDPRPYIPAEAAYQSTVQDQLVRAVQLEMEARGYYVGLHSGEYGFETRRAVRRYRRDYDLPINGKIDHDLLRSLGLH